MDRSYRLATPRRLAFLRGETMSHRERDEYAFAPERFSTIAGKCRLSWDKGNVQLAERQAVQA